MFKYNVELTGGQIGTLLACLEDDLKRFDFPCGTRDRIIGVMKSVDDAVMLLHGALPLIEVEEIEEREIN